MKTISITLSGVVVLLLAFGLNCGDGDGNDHAGHNHDGAHHDGGHHTGGHHMQAQTKVVKLEGVQAAFDLSTADHHAKMAKQMGMDWTAPAGTDHHLSITLMDLAAKKVIKEGTVQISVTGPDGNTISRQGDVMSGGGMHHHGLDFQMSGPGTYKAKVEFTFNGKSFAPEAEFKM